jgi:predicted dehydrogenase
LRFSVRGKTTYEYVSHLSDQPYLRGEHLNIEEPHVYVDIMDLVDSIRDQRAPRATGEQARHVVEIIEAAHNSAATGQAQTLSSTF